MTPSSSISPRCCPVVLCAEDADAFFAVLCRIIDRELERVVTEVRAGRTRPPRSRNRNGQKLR